MSSINKESTSTQKHNCCTLQPKGKVECPICTQKAKGVLTKTLDHLLTSKAKKKLSCLDNFYYCKNPECRTIYFRDKEILTQEDMSIIVGLKDGASPATMCYCFDWTKEKISAELKEKGESRALEDIKEKMKDPGCSCEILNPSGGCCLADIGKTIKEMETKFI